MYVYGEIYRGLLLVPLFIGGWRQLQDDSCHTAAADNVAAGFTAAAAAVPARRTRQRQTAAAAAGQSAAGRSAPRTH